MNKVQIDGEIVDKVRVGDRLTVAEPEKTASITTGESVQLNKGDVAVVDSDGFAHYLTGEAKGTIQKIFDSDQVEGYNHIGIAEMILERLDIHFSVSSILEQEGVEDDDVLIQIAQALQGLLQ